LKNLTEEQLNIIFSEKEHIHILARAGTGKTTTLVEFTKQRPFEVFLYLAYNTAIKEEASKKFFGNTEVHNIHSLAFKHIGYVYEHKLLDGNIKLIDIIFGIEDLKTEYEKDKTNNEIYSIANKVLLLLTSFFNSKDKKMSYTEEDILLYAQEYFSKMQDLDNESVKMTHDCYLKLFHLSNPILDYDYILVDEAQDSNEVMLDIVLSQNSKKIFVGDNFQSIYGYRNLINVFNLDLDATQYFLTKSFRFGETISFVVNELLQFYKDNPKPIEGMKFSDSVSILDYSTPYTFITRTNAFLFDLAARATLQNKKIHIIGGENFVFQELLDTMNLYCGKLYKIKNFHIKEFKSFTKMKKIAEQTQDQELKFLCKVVEKYNMDIENIIFRIKQHIVKERNADIVFTTVHKSKGLEFFNVRLANDFYPLISKKGNLIPKDLINQEEINIYYVAMTRAIENLELNEQLYKFLELK